MMSRRTRSNGSARIFSSACFPFSAVTTVWDCCCRRRDSRSRFISTSSTTRIRPDSLIAGRRSAGQEAAKERKLLLGRSLPLLDDVRDLVRVEQADAVLELRNDREDL